MAIISQELLDGDYVIRFSDYEDGSIRLTNANLPINDTDVANKKYVDDNKTKDFDGTLSDSFMSCSMNYSTESPVYYGYAIIDNRTNSYTIYTHEGIFNSAKTISISDTGIRIGTNLKSSFVVDRNPTGKTTLMLRDQSGDYVGIESDGSISVSSHILSLGSIPFPTIIRYLKDPEKSYDAATKNYVDTEISKLSQLPTVTSEDDGKILKVVNGQWTVTNA